jgi:WD40 repeat protein
MTEIPNATSKVFISYSRRNKKFAKKLNDSLDSNGVDAWVDWEGIPLSSDWMDEITRAIEAADAFLFIISPDSLASEVCASELELGLKYNKKLVPILYLEPEKGQQMHETLAATNWVYMREQDDYEATIPALIDTIQTDLDWVREHTRLLLRAKEWDEKGRDNSFLLQGSDLNEAESWMVDAANDDSREVTSLHGEYIQTSRMAATKRQRNLLIGVSLALVVSIGMAIFAMFQRADAVRNANVAATQQSIAEYQADVAATQQALAEANAAEAKAQQAIAEENAIRAQAQRAAAEARIYQTLPGALDLSTLLAINSWQMSESFLAEDILRRNASVSALPVAQMKQDGKITSIEISPNGKFFASASEDNSVCLWDSQNGAEQNCVEHDSVVSDVLFAIDSNFFVSGTENGNVYVWNVSDGSLAKSYEFGASEIFDIDLRPDGGQIAVAHGDGYVSVIDMTDLDSEPRDLEIGEIVLKVAYSPNNEWLGLGALSGQTFIWSVQNDFYYEGSAHTGKVIAIDFSVDSRWMISGGADSTVRTTEVTQNGIARMVLTHGDWVEDVEFGPSGVWFASASDDTNIRVWDVETGIEKVRMKHGDFAVEIDISDNGAWIASTSDDRTARVWDSASGSQMFQIPLEDDGVAIKFNEEANRLLVGDDQGNLSLWDTSALLTRLNVIEFPELVHEVRYSKDGAHIAVNADDANIWEFRVERTLEIKDVSGGDKISIPNNVLTFDTAYSPDGQWYAAGAWHGRNVFLYNRQFEQEEEEKTVFEIELESDVYALDFSPDSTQIAISTASGSTHILELESLTEIAVYEIDGVAHMAVSYHPDGQHLAISMENRIAVLNLETGTVIATLPHNGGLHHIQYSPDGKLLGTASTDGTVYLWDFEKDYVLLRDMNIRVNGDIWALAFSPDSTYLAVGSSNYFAYLWDLSKGQEISRIPHADKVTGIDFSPDGLELATASRKTVQLWDIEVLSRIYTDSLVETACSYLVSNMTRSEWEAFYGEEEYRTLCPALDATGQSADSK